MSDTVNHHFIPQFYLRGFSNAVDRRKAQVFVFDQSTRKTFTTLVRNIGARRNFFRIDVEGYDPNHVEDEMAKIESEIASHLADVIAAKGFPSDEHFTSVMNLMGNVAVRNPRFRSMNEGMHRKVADLMLRMTLQEQARYEDTIKRARQDGVSISDDVKYEEVRELVDRGEFEIDIDQSYLIGLELKSVIDVVEQLAKRNWSFVSAEPGTSFVTCDDPVVLSWANPNRIGAYSPGFGIAGTMVLFPLSHNLALNGIFEVQEQNLNFRRDQVASFNTSIAKNATKQIYARDGEFELHTRTERFIRGKDLPAALGRQSERVEDSGSLI